jgi:hypothetical protein
MTNFDKTRFEMFEVEASLKETIVLATGLVAKSRTGLSGIDGKVLT